MLKRIFLLIEICWMLGLGAATTWAQDTAVKTSLAGRTFYFGLTGSALVSNGQAAGILTVPASMSGFILFLPDGNRFCSTTDGWHVQIGGQDCGSVDLTLFTGGLFQITGTRRKFAASGALHTQTGKYFTPGNPYCTQFSLQLAISFFVDISAGELSAFVARTNGKSFVSSPILPPSTAESAQPTPLYDLALSGAANEVAVKTNICAPVE
jgi:hypothetical protein